jgi:hypothetical protein
MRPLLGLLAAAAIAGGFYFYSIKKMPSTDAGTAPTHAISLTGVRGDLLQIAQAERTYIATNGRCAPLNELIDSAALSMSRTERDGYQYSVECSNLEYNVIARHAAPSTDPGVRYPTLAIDQSMQVHEMN